MEFCGGKYFEIQKKVIVKHMARLLCSSQLYPPPGPPGNSGDFDFQSSKSQVKSPPNAPAPRGRPRIGRESGWSAIFLAHQST